MDTSNNDKNTVPFDPSFLLSQVDQDRAMLLELATTFQRTYLEKIEEIKSAIQAQDPHKLMEAAHYLKGDLGTMGHPPATEIAQKLESLGHGGSVAGADVLLVALVAAAKPILAFIAVLVQEKHA